MFVCMCVCYMHLCTYSFKTEKMGVILLHAPYFLVKFKMTSVIGLSLQVYCYRPIFIGLLSVSSIVSAHFSFIRRSNRHHSPRASMYNCIYILFVHIHMYYVYQMAQQVHLQNLNKRIQAYTCVSFSIAKFYAHCISIQLQAYIMYICMESHIYKAPIFYPVSLFLALIYSYQSW